MGSDWDFGALVGVAGWLTEAQARELHRAAAACAPGARIVEIGSHHGRSTVALALGNPAAVVTAIDPFPADWRYGGPDTERRFREHRRPRRRRRPGRPAGRHQRRRARRVARARATCCTSTASTTTGPCATTCGGPTTCGQAPRRTCTTPTARSASPSALLRDLLGSRRLRYAGRTGSLARLEAVPPTVRDRLRLLAPLPWFARNVVVKVLLRLRLRPVARLLGHHDTADPY